MNEEQEHFWSAIQHFTPEEFDAPGYPGSGLNVDSNLVARLDLIRKIVGCPIIVHPNGGFSYSGHCDNSYHYCGWAVDFHIVTDEPFREQARTILGLGQFGGVGLYPEWKPVPGFHVDIRQIFQLWVKRQGQYLYLFQ